MNSAFSCDSCPTVLGSREKLKAHKKRWHQERVLLKFSSVILTVERGSDGKFTCPGCNISSYGRPDKLQAHCRVCPTVQALAFLETEAFDEERDLPEDNRSELVGQMEDEIVGLQENGSTESSSVQRVQPLISPAEVSSSPRRIEDSIFVEFPEQRLKINRALGLVICTACNSGVPLHVLRRHVRNCSQHCLLPLSLMEDIRKACPNEYDFMALPTFQLVPQVLGLPVYEGWRCMGCEGSEICYYSATKGATLNHIRTRHSDNDTVLAKPEKCHVQTIRKGPAVKYFGVTIEGNSIESVAVEQSPPDPVDFYDNLFETYVMEQQEHVPGLDPAATAIAMVAADIRLTSDFVHAASEWLTLIRGKSLSGLVFLCSAPDAGTGTRDELTNISEAVEYFFRKSEDTIAKNFYLRTQLTSGAFPDLRNGQPFRLLQEESSRKKYIRTGVKYICFLLRVLVLEVDNGELQEAIRADFHPQFTLLLKPLAAQLLEGLRSEDSAEALFAKVHKLVYRSFALKLGYHDRPESFPVVLYLLFSTIQQAKDAPDDFTFGRIQKVTPTIAMLQYIARCSVGLQVIESSVAGSLGDADLALTYLRSGFNTPFGHLLSLMNLASSYCYQAPRLPNVTWLPSCEDGHIFFDTLLVDSHRVTLHGIRSLVDSLLKECQRLIDDDLLLGLACRASPTALSHWVDDRQNVDARYSFLTDTRNHLDPRAFLKAVLLSAKRGHLAAGLFARSLAVVGNSDGRRGILYQRQGSMSFLRKAEQATSLLLTLIHLTSGQPARCGELVTYRLRNSILAERSLYLDGGSPRIAIVSAYHKSRNILGNDKLILRLLPEAVSALLWKYLTLVRPLETTLAAAIYGGSAGEIYQDFLFVRRGGLMSKDSIRTTFRATFAKYYPDGAVALGVKAYRQAATAFAEKHILSASTSEHQQFMLLHQQAGHTVATANTSYGNGQYDFRYLSRDAEAMYKRASEAWHALIGSSRYILDHTLNQRPPPSLSAVERPLPAGPEINRGFLNGCVQGGRLQPSGRTIVQVEHIIRSQLTSTARETGFSGKISLGLMARCLKALRELLNDSQATFRSKEQAQVTCRLTGGSCEDVACVLPTGTGKTMVFLVPAYLEKAAGKVTVVVVPLIALLKDMIQNVGRRLAGKLRCTEWTSQSSATMHAYGCSTGYQIVFVQVENAISDAFKSFLCQLHESGKLARVVLDEAHCLKLWSSFRPAMRKLLELRSQVEVPFVLLSATFPKAWEDEFRSSTYGFPSLIVIRGSQVRRNLKFVVRLLPDDTGSDELDSTIERLLVEEGHNFQPDDRAILYVHSVRVAQAIAGKLISAGLLAGFFHGELTVNEKELALTSWKAGVFTVMVATKAFGMGVDYRSVRVVLHRGHSDSLIDYVQETGRAGRDGHPCKALLVTSKKILEQFGARFDGINSADPEAKSNYEQFCRWALHGGTECRREGLVKVSSGVAANTSCIVNGCDDVGLCDVCESIYLGMRSDRESNFHSHRESEVEYENDGLPVSSFLQPASRHYAAEWQRKEELCTQALYREIMDINQDLHRMRAEQPSGIPGCGYCLVIYATSIKHDPSRKEYCPVVNGRCFKCLMPTSGGHRAVTCPYKGVLTVRNRSDGICFNCLLPDKSRGCSFHPKQTDEEVSTFGTLNCNAIACGDLLRTVACHIWWETQTKENGEWLNEFDPQGDHQLGASLETFLQWLPHCSEGQLTNASRLFLWFIENRESFTRRQKRSRLEI